jgi:hypothetical protein
MKIKTSHIIISYFVIILYFGFIYSNIPGIFNENSFTFGHALYFSIVTITTLGYGDINPSSNLGMGFVAVESIIGIIYIALFSGAIWQTYVSNLEKAQTKQIKKELTALNVRKLKMFADYFLLVIKEYRIAYAQFMMPLSKISKNSKLNVEFKYSDLKYILENSTNQPVVGMFYEKQDACNENIKYLLSNAEVYSNKRLYTAILNFLHLSLINDPRNAILSTEDTQKHDNQEQTVIDQNSSTLIKPIKVFYKTLKIQYKYLKIIHHELKTMIS